MVAAGRTVEEVREYIGATSLAYLSLEGLVEATKRPGSELCRACLTRGYPTAVPAEHAKLRFESPRVARDTDVPVPGTGRRSAAPLATFR